MWHLSVVVLVAALVTRLFVSRTTTRRHLALDAAARTHAAPLHVVLAAREGDPWRARVDRLLELTPLPISVSVLLLCDAARAPDVHAAATHVHVELAVAKSAHPNRVLRRLVRRFVIGSEELVVVLQGDAHLAPTWADVLPRLRALLPRDAVVSCPPASRAGGAQFPTLRTRSTGAAARDAARPFDGDATEALELVPSVCWCPEATVASGATLRKWCALTTDSFVAQTRQEGYLHLVPTLPLLGAHDEDAVIDHDEGLPDVAARDCERAGVTHGADSNEKILKYGSVFRARVAARA